MSYSEAVNYNSFMNAIGDRIGVDSDYLYKFINVGTNAGGSRLMSVGEAMTVCEVFLTKMGLSLTGILIPILDDPSAALSLNTAKAIIDKYIGKYTWQVAFDTNNLGDLNTGISYRTIIKSPYLTSTSFDVTAIGGGAGGSGGATLDGNKNTNFSVNIIQGYAGSASSLYINDSSVVTADGGAQQAKETYSKVGGDPVGYKNGKTGYNGESSTVNVTINDGDLILGVKGAGGDGAGGLAINSSSSSTYTNSRNGVSANSWTSDRTAAAGGGGSGGNSSNSPGSSSMSGKQYSNVAATAGEQHQAIGTVSVGGRGGYNSHGTSGITQPAQGSTAGLGGTGGTHKRSDNNYCTSSGGNGGNSGTITGTSSVNIIYLLVS